MKRRIGFTLIELLVVVAIIVALLAILLPSMGRALKTAHVAVCSSQHAQLFNIWLSYAADNVTRFPGSETSRYRFDWIYLPPGTTTEVQQHLERGVIWSYVTNVKMYKCPEDTRTKALHTYSVNSVINGRTEVNPVSTISALPHPARLLATVDERDSRGLNFDGFVQWRWDSPNAGRWIDTPGTWHLDHGAVIGFADSHVEFYKTKDPSTASAQLDEPAPNNVDREYFQRIFDPR